MVDEIASTTDVQEDAQATADQPSTAELLIASAVIGTIMDIGTLGKSELNQHGGYNFVPIDRYYATVGKIAAAHGLSWTLREDRIEHWEKIGTKGAFQITYLVDVLHRDGWFVKGYSQISVFVPFTGAQTMGIAMSYADKIFMRQAFKVQSGEADADVTSPSDFERSEPAPTGLTYTAPETPAAQLANAETLWNTVSVFIPDCKTGEELRAFWRDNVAALKLMEQSNPDRYQQLVDAFKARREELGE